MNEALRRIFYNIDGGYPGLNELIERGRKYGIDKDTVKEWYRKQPVNQVFVPRIGKIYYHKTIGNGKSYQADIMFLPEEDGYIGMLTMINVSTRSAYFEKIADRNTDYLIIIFEAWLDLLAREGKEITSITTDNEFFNNNRIRTFFRNNGIQHYVERRGEHSKLGIINKFHRTIRDIMNKMMVGEGIDKWTDVVYNAFYLYNQRVHRITGRAPISMNDIDIARVNRKLMIQNRESVRRMGLLNVGDLVRYLVRKTIFSKGGNTYSRDIWTITAIPSMGYQIQISNGDQVMYRKYWELKKIN